MTTSSYFAEAYKLMKQGKLVKLGKTDGQWFVEVVDKNVETIGE